MAPETLSGPGSSSLFDPFLLSTFLDTSLDFGYFFNGITFGKPGEIDTYSFLREAEYINGRVAMVGVLGMIIPPLVGTVDGSPLDIPGSYLVVPALCMGVMEWRRINRILKYGSAYVPGDMQGWGPVGPGPRYNPYNFNYSDEEYANIQLAEVKHCRLAMLGFMGLFLQAKNSDMNVVDQLGALFYTSESYTF